MVHIICFRRKNLKNIFWLVAKAYFVKTVFFLGRGVVNSATRLNVAGFLIYNLCHSCFESLYVEPIRSMYSGFFSMLIFSSLVSKPCIYLTLIFPELSDIDFQYHFPVSVLRFSILYLAIPAKYPAVQKSFNICRLYYPFAHASMRY